MNLNSLMDGHKTENLIAIDRIATGGQLVIDIADIAVDDHEIVAAVGHQLLPGISRQDLSKPRPECFLFLFTDQRLDLKRIDLPRTDLEVKIGCQFDSVMLEQLADDIVGEFDFPVFEFPEQDLPAVGGFAFAGLVEGSPDAVPRLGGDHKIEPVDLGMLVMTGFHGHGIPVLEFVAKRHLPVVHLAPHTTVPQI